MCITHVLQSRCKTFQEKVFHSRKVELFVAFRGLCFCEEPSKINDESPQHAAILSLQSQGPKGLLWGSAGMAGTCRNEENRSDKSPPKTSIFSLQSHPSEGALGRIPSTREFGERQEN